MITAQWVTPLRGSDDPLETISAEFAMPAPTRVAAFQTSIFQTG